MLMASDPNVSLSPVPDLPPSDRTLTRGQVLKGMALSSLLLLLIAVAAVQLSGLAWSDILFQWSLPAVGIGLVLGLCVWGISRGLYQTWIPYQQASQGYMELVLKPLQPVDLLWLGLLPGISEEILFRGILLAAWGTSWAAILLASGLFGAAHLLSPKMWPYGVWAGVVGLVMATSFVVTGNLLVPITAHVLTNILSGATWQRRYRHEAKRDLAD